MRLCGERGKEASEDLKYFNLAAKTGFEKNKSIERFDALICKTLPALLRAAGAREPDWRIQNARVLE